MKHSNRATKILAHAVVQSRGLSRPRISTSSHVQLIRPISTSSSRLAYRPPVLPDADLPLGETEEPKGERFNRAKMGFRMFIRYCGWGFAILGVGTFAYFEGTHLYVERYKLPPTSDYTSSSSSRSSSSSLGHEDETDLEDFGWDDEVVSWTGGHLGGTSPRLGQKGRHALRAAWMYLTWSASLEKSTMPKQGLFEPDFMLLRRLETADSAPVRKGNRSAGKVDTYLAAALEAARAKGMVFPPELSVTRPTGPPKTTGGESDPVVRDLLLLRAANLERTATLSSLVDAKEMYERILCSTSSDRSPRQEARMMRLAKKVGDLCERIGADQEGLQWYDWGLARTGIRLDDLTTKISSWFGSSEKTIPTGSIVSPALVRATISLLTAAETHYATHAQLSSAWDVQSAALSLFPNTSRSLTPTKDNADAILHQIWLANRQAMLNLHRASVAHALKDKKALSIAETASSQADRTLSAIDPLPPVFTPSQPTALSEPTRQLERDSLLTAAEASFTLGRLLETSRRPDLERVAKCFERAADLDARQSGHTEESTMGKEWHKYWRNYVRVKAQLGEVVESPFADKEVEWKGRDEVILEAMANGMNKFLGFFDAKRQ